VHPFFQNIIVAKVKRFWRRREEVGRRKTEVGSSKREEGIRILEYK